MTEIENTRKIFMDELIEVAKTDESIIGMDADVGVTTYMKYFAQKYPQRFYQMGIAEQNMYSTASGLASEGLTVFAATFAVFASMRACEMIRTYICYPKRNVKIIGGYAGLSNGKDGATHQSIEDISIMRSFPNMVVMAVSDQVVAKKIARLAADYEGPMYLRMEYEPVEKIHKPDMKLEIGRGYVVKQGKDVTIVSYGTALSRTIKASIMLADDGIDAEIIDMPSIKPFDKGLLINSVEKTGAIITLEDHNIYGGLASAVSETLFEAGTKAKYKKLAINDFFTDSVQPYQLRKAYNLDETAVYNSAKEILKS